MKFSDLLNKEVNYNNVIISKEGYKISNIIATTYSLDLSLIAVLTVLANDNKQFSNMEFALKSCLVEQNLWIFYQYNKVQAREFQANYRGALGHFFDKFCIGIKPKDMIEPKDIMPCFHPKILIIEYVSTGEEKYLYRLAVGSRNLTQSNMFETIAIFETKIFSESRFSKINFSVAKSEREFPETLYSFLNSGEFKPINNSCFINCEIIFVYNNNLKIYEKMKLDTAKSIIAVSPGFEKNPITRMENDKAKFYYKQGSHAKMYFIERETELELWIGSANCTALGLGDKEAFNSECMVKLSLNSQNASVNDFVAWLKFNGFEKVEVEQHQYDSDDQTRELDKVISKIIPIKAILEKEAKGYKITFKTENKNKRNIIFSDIGDIEIYLFGKEEKKAYSIKDILSDGLMFDELKLTEVLPILVFKATKFKATEGERAVSCIIKAEIIENKNVLEKAYKGILNKLFNNPPLVPDSPDEKTTNIYINRNGSTSSEYKKTSSVKHGEYEKLIRYYEKGEDVRGLLEFLEKNKEIFGVNNEKYIVVIGWLKELCKDGDNG